MTRREVRDCAFKLVFEQLLRDDDINELYEVVDDKNSNSQKLVQRIGGESTKEKGTFMMRR